VRETDGVRYVQPRLGDIRRSSRSEEAVERVAVIDGVASANQNAGDVGAAKCTAGGLRYDVVEADRGACARETVDYGPATVHALALESLQARADRTNVADVQGKQVNLEVAIVRAQLAAAHNPNANALTSRDSLVASGNRIMIGYCDSLQMSPHGGFDKTGWRHRAIGRRGMSVQIDVALCNRRGAGLSHLA
jgi:hypothetical protein